MGFNSGFKGLTWALDKVGGQYHAPAPLPPGKTRYPLYRRLGRLQSRSGQVRKTSPPSGFDPQTVQPAASHYTNYAIQAPRTETKPSGILLLGESIIIYVIKS